MIAAVADLIGVTRQLAAEVQKIAIHLERETTLLPEPGELPLILSELSELHQRLRKLPATPALPKDMAMGSQAFRAVRDVPAGP